MCQDWAGTQACGWAGPWQAAEWPCCSISGAGADVGSCVMGSPGGWHSEAGLGVLPQALAFLWLHLE